jgi:hypothetical protein
MEKEFIIRSYGYCELAMLYFPNSTKKSASAQFGRWIRQNESLKLQLAEAGFKKGRRILTPKQVDLLVNILGSP